MKYTHFSGFSPEGMDLLIQNRLMNSKAFYESQKEQIRQQVLAPFHALCEQMTPTMLEIDPLFVTIPSKMVSRVRRDTRYTKDKTLYRANVWLSFRRPRSQRETVPFFYMEISPDFWGYGCFGGFGSGEMDIAREMILKQDARFQAAYDCVSNQSIFHLDGECYKRPKFPDAPQTLQTWLNRKHLGLNFVQTEDFSPLWDGSFVQPMLEAFSQIAPFYQFLLTLREQARKEGGR